jgi:hypothetical protein
MNEAALQELNWYWIVLGATAPPLVAMAVAMPLWRRNQPVLGSIAGTAIIFGTAVGLILREYVELDRLTQACIDAGTVCWPQPPEFTRFAIYAFVGLIEVFALFFMSLKLEERRRRRDYAPEWQR